MPYHVVTRIAEALNGHGKSLKGAKVLVLGVAYKKDSADSWGSPALKIIDLLHDRGAVVSYNDPFIAHVNASAGAFESVKINEEHLSAADCVVIATDHSSFDLEQVASCAQLVFDTRGVTRNLKAQANIFRLGEDKKRI
jgi:UDP-N-acetyl-D-glucosamine dehydrogenase